MKRMKKMKKFHLLRPLAVMMVLTILLSALSLGGCVMTPPEATSTQPTETTPPDTSTMTGVEHFQYVENKALAEMTESISETYSQIFSLMSMGGTQVGGTGIIETPGTQVLVEMSFGDMYIQQMEKQYTDMGMPTDMSWMRDIGIIVNMNADGAFTQNETLYRLAGADIMTMVIYQNITNGEMFLGVPEISDDFLKVDTADGFRPDSQTGSILSALPSEEVLTRLLNRYIPMLLKDLDDVTKATGIMELEGLQQKCTSLTAKIYEEDALNISKKVLTTAKTDEDLKTVVEDLGPYLNMGPDPYAEFLDSIDEALAEIEEDLKDPDTENYVTLTTYTDGNDKVIGRELKDPQEDEEFSYLTVTQGDQFAVRLELGSDMLIKASGTNTDGKINGKAQIRSNGITMITAEMKDIQLNEKGLKGGLTVTLNPTMMGGSAAAAMSIDVSLDVGEKGGNIDVSILMGKEVYMTLNITAAQTEASPVTPPTQSLDGSDPEELEKWLAEMDVEQVKENLRKAGIPDVYIEIISGTLITTVFGNAGVPMQPETDFPE